MAVSTKHIASIFTNVLFAVGVVLCVVGFIGGISTVAKLVFFEAYPLPYGEDRCVYAEPIPERALVESELKENDADSQAFLERCKETLEKDRARQQVEDITRSIGFLVSGGVMAYVFRKRE